MVLHLQVMFGVNVAHIKNCGKLFPMKWKTCYESQRITAPPLSKFGHPWCPDAVVCNRIPLWCFGFCAPTSVSLLRLACYQSALLMIILVPILSVCTVPGLRAARAPVRQAVRYLLSLWFLLFCLLLYLAFWGMFRRYFVRAYFDVFLGLNSSPRTWVCTFSISSYAL